MNLIIKNIGKNKSLNETLSDEKFKNFSLIEMEQTHSDNFIEIFEAPEKKQTIPNVDALITTKKNILLAVKSADCLPILIHWNDGNNKNVIAAIHSGRVGTEKKILTKVLNYLKLKYGIGSKKSPTSLDENLTNNLTIWLGPAICNKCYQINKEKNLHFDLYQKNIDQIAESFPKIELQAANMILNVERSEFCTLHNNELFHSYRKSGTGVAMNYSLIGLTEG